MTLPAATDFTGAAVTEGQFKTAMTALRTYLATLLGTDESNKVAALTALGSMLNSKLDKSSAYTVVAADKGKVINATTGTWSLTLTAAATLGDGFVFGVLNSGAGTITIDPNASEQIDGATTKTVAAGKLTIVYCDGAKFTTIGSIATGAGSGLDADLLDGQHGSYYAKDWTVGSVTSLAGLASVDFTSIPSTAKEIVLLYYGVYDAGSQYLYVQLGDSGGIETTGYIGSMTLGDTSGGAVSSVTATDKAYAGRPGSASWNSAVGRIDITLLDSTNKVWVVDGQSARGDGNYPTSYNASKATSATLDRVRFGIVSGTMTAGSIVCMYR